MSTQCLLSNTMCDFTLTTQTTSHDHINQPSTLNTPPTFDSFPVYPHLSHLNKHIVNMCLPCRTTPTSHVSNMSVTHCQIQPPHTHPSKITHTCHLTLHKSFNLMERLLLSHTPLGPKRLLGFKEFFPLIYFSIIFS